ncbi:hypothetical protein BC936DRAFT_145384 [Jimgerdemannia flammicorona]|uniref:Ion transport domain-containing protein n=1 Tax=Jimgerdemannia flammicorona TaxID=994334 RepID=A0A433DA41_9FUNG|nr:hypothetical protein BC936DRAFT_145384 [Jimgerdemannia flammicorona]
MSKFLQLFSSSYLSRSARTSPLELSQPTFRKGMTSPSSVRLIEVDTTEPVITKPKRETWVVQMENSSDVFKTHKITNIDENGENDLPPMLRAEPSTDGHRLVTFHGASHHPTMTIVWWTVGFEPDFRYSKLFQTTVSVNTHSSYLGALAISNCGSYVIYGVSKSSSLHHGAVTHTVLDDGRRNVVHIALSNLQSNKAWFAYDDQGDIENLVISDSDKALILVYDSHIQNIIHRYANDVPKSLYLRRASWRLTEKYYSTNAIDRDNFASLHSLHMAELLMPINFRPIDYALSRGNRMLATFGIDAETKAYYIRVILLENLVELTSVKVGERERITPHLKYFAFTHNDSCITMTLGVGHYPPSTQLYRWNFYSNEDPQVHLNLPMQNIEGVFRSDEYWCIILRQGTTWALEAISPLDEAINPTEDYTEPKLMKEGDEIPTTHGNVMQRWFSHETESRTEKTVVYSEDGTRSLEVMVNDGEHESWRINLLYGGEVIFDLPLGWCTDSTKCIFKVKFLDGPNHFFVADKTYFQLWRVDDDRTAVLEYAQIIAGGDVNVMYEEGDAQGPVDAFISPKKRKISRIQIVRQHGANRIVEDVPLHLTMTSVYKTALRTFETFVHLLQSTAACSTIAGLPLFDTLLHGCQVRITECVKEYPIIRVLGIVHFNMLIGIDRYIADSTAYTSAHKRVFDQGVNFILELLQSNDLYISTSPMAHSDFPMSADTSKKLSSSSSPQAKILLPYFLRSMTTRPAYLRSVTAGWNLLCVGSPKVALTFLHTAACVASPFTLTAADDLSRVATKYISGQEMTSLSPAACLIDVNSEWAWRLFLVRRYLCEVFQPPDLDLTGLFPLRGDSTVLCVNPLPHFGSYVNLTYRDSWIHPRSPFTAVVDYLFDSDDIFDLPMMEATIMFKWRTFARTRWIWLRMIPHLVNSSAFFAAAVMVSDPVGAYPQTALALMVIVVLFSVANLCHEIMQAISERLRYVRSWYNWFDLLTIGLTIASAVPTIQNPNLPQQNWVLSLTVILVWVHTLLQLRVFRAIGTYVDILWELLKQVGTFLMILALLVLAFANGLFIYLRGQVIPPPAPLTGFIGNSISITLQQPMDTVNKFVRFDESLKSTYLFLTGDYSSISPWDGDPLVDIIKIAFSFITVIMMLNVLIAILSDVINMAREQGKRRWLRELAQVIVEIERTMLLPFERRNPHWFPEFIFYGADPDTIKYWEKEREVEAGLEPEEVRVLKGELKMRAEALDQTQQTVAEQREQIKVLLQLLGSRAVTEGQSAATGVVADGATS